MDDNMMDIDDVTGPPNDASPEVNMADTASEANFLMTTPNNNTPSRNNKRIAANMTAPSDNVDETLSKMSRPNNPSIGDRIKNRFAGVVSSVSPNKNGKARRLMGDSASNTRSLQYDGVEEPEDRSPKARSHQQAAPHQRLLEHQSQSQHSPQAQVQANLPGENGPSILVHQSAYLTLLEQVSQASHLQDTNEELKAQMLARDRDIKHRDSIIAQLNKYVEKKYLQQMYDLLQSNLAPGKVNPLNLLLGGSIDAVGSGSVANLRDGTNVQPWGDSPHWNLGANNMGMGSDGSGEGGHILTPDEIRAKFGEIGHAIAKLVWTACTDFLFEITVDDTVEPFASALQKLRAMAITMHPKKFLEEGKFGFVLRAAIWEVLADECFDPDEPVPLKGSPWAVLLKSFRHEAETFLKYSKPHERQFALLEQARFHLLRHMAARTLFPASPSSSSRGGGRSANSDAAARAATNGGGSNGLASGVSDRLLSIVGPFICAPPHLRPHQRHRARMRVAGGLEDIVQKAVSLSEDLLKSPFDVCRPTRKIDPLTGNAPPVGRLFDARSMIVSEEPELGGGGGGINSTPAGRARSGHGTPTTTPHRPKVKTVHSSPGSGGRGGGRNKNVDLVVEPFVVVRGDGQGRGYDQERLLVKAGVIVEPVHGIPVRPGVSEDVDEIIKRATAEIDEESYKDGRRSWRLGRGHEKNVRPTVAWRRRRMLFFFFFFFFFVSMMGGWLALCSLLSLAFARYPRIAFCFYEETQSI
ncbi:hypothetical protein MKZ38_000798 [Zalerion maritima]|uniref:Uncharacterized protein n=1 Tax=Zalerion maritima TaxID=339359 RepID=A0AAD5RSF2_9PEZI|nr:hypothetical protein MKZ38_000798 [Zalerion maritima]